MTDVAINWFELPVSDLARASRFYEAVLQTKIDEMPGPDGPMKIFVQDGRPIGMLDASEQASSSQNGVIIYFNTADVGAALERVTSAGGAVAVPATSIGEHGAIGQFIDSEGNRVALHCP